VVAVLPFENLSGSPEQDYLSDGLTDEIIAALGRFRWFPVIARSSTAAYKTALHDVRHLGTMLGATYILTGTMRHHADRIRITSQLADTETGVQIWVQTYDGVRSDVFEFQEEIASSVVAAIEPRLIEAERQRSQLKRPENLTAYDLYLRAMVDFYATSAQQTEAALRYLDEAIRLDPSYAPADALAAERRVYACAQGYIKALHDIRADGERLARKALELDSEDPTVLMLAGHALSYHTRDWDIGLLWLEKALALNPSSVMARCFAGWAKNHAGVPLEAISHFEEAARLSPLDRSGQLYSTGMAVALVMADRHREAVVWGRRAVAEAPSYAAAYRALAAALANDGQQAEARAIGQRAMKLQPEYRISEHAEQFRICPECSLYRDGLLIAGLTP
jgi:adenylate cyclase